MNELANGRQAAAEPGHDGGPTPDYILERQASEAAGLPPPSLTKEYLPHVVDEMWRGHLEEVDAAVARPLDVEPPGGPQEAQLARIMRCYAELESAEDRLDTYYQRAKSHIKQRRDALDFRRYNEARGIVTSLIGTGKRKSVETPYGRAGFRTRPEKLGVLDPRPLIEAWQAKQIPDACVSETTTVKPVHAELQKLYKETGEIPPGCVIEPAAEQFYMG